VPGDAVSAVELENPLGHVVQEVTVVGDRDHRAGILLQIALEPRDRLGVQMVGGLIEEQHVRAGQQQPAQRHPALFAARERGDARLPRRQAQSVGGDLQLALQLPAASGVDGVLQLRLLLEERVHLVLGHFGLEALADLIEALQVAERFAQPLHDRLAHFPGRVELRLLRQEADPNPALGTGLAVDVLVDAGHDLQERGLAGAVQAQHADLGAGEKRQADVAQDDPFRGHHLRHALHGVDVLSHGFHYLRGGPDWRWWRRPPVLGSFDSLLRVCPWWAAAP
jgi:hypothetical protein